MEISTKEKVAVAQGMKASAAALFLSFSAKKCGKQASNE